MNAACRDLRWARARHASQNGIDWDRVIRQLNKDIIAANDFLPDDKQVCLTTVCLTPCLGLRTQGHRHNGGSSLLSRSYRRCSQSSWSWIKQNLLFWCCNSCRISRNQQSLGSKLSFPGRAELNHPGTLMYKHLEMHVCSYMLRCFMLQCSNVLSVCLLEHTQVVSPATIALVQVCAASARR